MNQTYLWVPSLSDYKNTSTICRIRKHQKVQILEESVFRSIGLVVRSVGNVVMWWLLTNLGGNISYVLDIGLLGALCYLIINHLSI